MTKYFLVAIMVIGFSISCGGEKKTQGTDTQSGSKASEQGTVLAKVNGETLTKQELEYQLPSQYRGQLSGKDLDDAVESWINTQLLYQQGVKKGLDKDPEVEAVMKFRKGDAVARRLIEMEIANKAAVTPHEVDSIYASQKEMYKLDRERLRASHIMMQSKEEAEAIYNRIKKGDDFGKLAAEYSVDKQSAASGGDLGFFTADQIDTAFFNAASKLKIGEVSAPIKSQYGYHIIKLTDRQAAGANMDSLEVKSKISDDLTTMKQNEVYTALIDSLKKNAKIEKFTSPDTTKSTVPGAK